MRCMPTQNPPHPQFTTLAGQEAHLAEWAGHCVLAVVLPWLPGAHDERLSAEHEDIRADLEDVEALFEDYMMRGFFVLGFVMPDAAGDAATTSDEWERLGQWYSKNGLTFPLLRAEASLCAPGGFFAEAGPEAMHTPWSRWVIDQDGAVVSTWSAEAEVYDTALTDAIEPLLPL